jgi:hypothetical protein
MVNLNPVIYQAHAKLFIQDIFNSIKQCKIDSINSSLRNPLILHNIVAYNTEILRSSFKKKHIFEFSMQNFALRSKLDLFSYQFFEKHFNSNDKRELAELHRNIRVIRFFVEDKFFYRFDKRPHWHILYEDVFFNSIPSEEAVKIGELYEKLFDDLEEVGSLDIEHIRRLLLGALILN